MSWEIRLVHAIADFAVEKPYLYLFIQVSMILGTLAAILRG